MEALQDKQKLQMKTFSELVECLACKAGVFFWDFWLTKSWGESKKDSKGEDDVPK